MRRLKPGASVRTHLLVAATIWSVVGVFLMARGVGWLAKPAAAWLALLATVAGTVKSLVVLDRAARRNILRILDKREGSCIGGVYSPKMWGLVLLMMATGILLRSRFSPLPLAYAGILYIAIGWGLLFSSRLIWQQWRRSAHGAEG